MSVIIHRDLFLERHFNHNSTSESEAFNLLWKWMQAGSLTGIIDQYNFQTINEIFRDCIGIYWSEATVEFHLNEIRSTIDICVISIDIQRQIPAILEAYNSLLGSNIEDLLLVLSLACAIVLDADYIVAYNPKSAYGAICQQYSVRLCSPSELVQIIRLDRIIQLDRTVHLEDVTILRNWLEKIYREPWRPVSELQPVESYRDSNVGGYIPIEWEINGNHISLALILKLLPSASNESDGMELCVQVYPYHQIYLPSDLQLIIWDEPGEFRQEIQVEPGDYCIQSELTASLGDRFSIVVSCGNRNIQEDLIV